MKSKVYFDGACHLCSREVEHYRNKDKLGKLEFIDISTPAFSAQAEGLDPERVQRIMHLRDEEGKLHLGVDAFIQIWNSIPGYGAFSKIAKLPFINPALKLGYSVFAALRPYLPKRKNANCETGACFTPGKHPDSP